MSIIFSGVGVALLLGIVASSCLHLSQGLMRWGIQRMKMNRSDSQARRVYVAGLLLNFTAPLWVMVANLFAPTIWFTSMFATGLITLLVFSHYYLDDSLTITKVIGAIAIVLATLMLTLSGLHTLAETNIQLPILIVCSVVWVVLTPCIALGMKKASLTFQEIHFGCAAGGFFALDSLWKSTSQMKSDGSVSFLPADPIGWLIFLVSFMGAAGAFFMMQWSYLRHCRATSVVIGHNAMYVLLPIAILLYAAGMIESIAALNAFMLAALGCLIVGVGLLYIAQIKGRRV